MAGCRAADISDGARALWGTISQFVSMPPDPNDCLALLVKAISAGGAVVVTLNPQVLHKGADAWHHQFVYGVDTSTRTVFLSNPLQAMPLEEFMAEGSSAPQLRVRMLDLLCRSWPESVHRILSSLINDRVDTQVHDASGTACEGDDALETLLDVELAQALAANPGPVPALAFWKKLGVVRQLSQALRATATAIDADGLDIDALGSITIPASCECADRL